MRISVSCFVAVFAAAMLISAASTSAPLKIVYVVGPGSASHLYGSLDVVLALVERGHDVYFASFDEQVSWAYGTGMKTIAVGALPFSLKERQDYLQKFQTDPRPLWEVVAEIFTDYQLPLYESLLLGLNRTVFQDERKPDLMICDFFAEGCCDWANYYHIPYVMRGPLEYAGVYDSPHNDHMFVDGPAPRTFFARLKRTVLAPYRLLPAFLPLMKAINNIRVKYGLPTVSAPSEFLKKHVYLFDSWMPVTPPMSLPPYVVDCGLNTPKSPKPLTGDLQRWMDDAHAKGESVILFALGSVATLTRERAVALQHALARVAVAHNVRVVFADSLESLPRAEAIEVSRFWFAKHVPQEALLQHPAMRVFVSHGGKLSYTESLAAGIPMLVVPFFGDQPFNSRRLTNLGVAERLLTNAITEDEVVQKLTALLTQPRYRERAQFYQRIIQHTAGMNVARAVAMVEMAATIGIDHLIPEEENHMYFAKYNVDVVLTIVAVFLTVVVVVLYVLVRLLKLLWRCVFRGKPKQKTQ